MLSRDELQGETVEGFWHDLCIHGALAFAGAVHECLLKELHLKLPATFANLPWHVSWRDDCGLYAAKSHADG